MEENNDKISVIEENQKKINELLAALTTGRITDDERVDAFLEIADLSYGSDRFKYASLATVSTVSPRADACCFLAEEYMYADNNEWAIIWFNHAKSNFSEHCDKKYYTWYPLFGIAEVYVLKKDVKNARKYLDFAYIMGADIESVNRLTLAIDELEKVSKN